MALQDISRVEAFKTEAQRKIDRCSKIFPKERSTGSSLTLSTRITIRKLNSRSRRSRWDDPALLETPFKATVDILQAHMGKAVGIMIYHNRTGMFVDTLGTFDIPAARIAPIVNDFTQLMECNRFIDGHVERIRESGMAVVCGWEAIRPSSPCFSTSHRPCSTGRSSACTTTLRLPMNPN